VTVIIISRISYRREFSQKFKLKSSNEIPIIDGAREMCFVKRRLHNNRPESSYQKLQLQKIHNKIK
jgi:hypothetical protein